MKLDYHAVSVGETQSGKTYNSVSLLQENRNTLRIFVNTKHENRYYKNFRFIISSVEEIRFILRDVNEHGLNNSYIYCYNPPIKDRGRKKFIKFIDEIFEMKRDGRIPVKTILCVDEVRNYKGDALKAINNIALMGLGFDLILYSVSQRIQHFPTDIRENTDIFMINQCPNTQLEFMVVNSIIEIPDSLCRVDKHGEPYMYKYNLWSKKKDRTIYIKQPGEPLARLTR